MRVPELFDFLSGDLERTAGKEGLDLSRLDPLVHCGLGDVEHVGDFGRPIPRTCWHTPPS